MITATLQKVFIDCLPVACGLTVALQVQAIQSRAVKVASQFEDLYVGIVSLVNDPYYCQHWVTEKIPMPSR